MTFLRKEPLQMETVLVSSFAESRVSDTAISLISDFHLIKDPMKILHLSDLSKVSVCFR